VAHQLSIAVVQQEQSLAPHLSIAENIGLDGRLAAAVAEIGKELDLVADTPVERLPLEPRSLADKVLILARSPERCCWRQ
jgi:ABC-type sugar transport system ATPase subunit